VCALAALVALYWLAPPLPDSTSLLLWGGGTLVLMAMFNLRQALVGGWRHLTGVLMTHAESAYPASSPLLTFYRTTFQRLLLVGLASGVIILPVAYSFKRTLNSEISLVYRVRHGGNVDFHLSDHFHNISRLEDYVVPGKATARRTYTVDRLTRVSYVGLITLSLALLAALRVRRKHVGWWLGMAVACTMFSLGPFLYVTEHIHSSGRFPLYMWMYDYFPFFSQISIPFRFNVLAVLALAVLAAYTLSTWMRGKSVLYQGLLSLSVSLAVLFEVMLVSPAPFPIPLASTQAPPYFRALGAEKGNFGILNIPIQRVEGELLPGEYFFYQTLHGKSIPNRVEGEIPLYVHRNKFTVHLFDLEHDWLGYPRQDETVLRKSIQELKDFHFKYIVVHDNLLRPGARDRIHGVLRHFMGAPRRQSDNIWVYSVYADAPTIAEREPTVADGARARSRIP
jgi:hypothetical protein